MRKGIYAQRKVPDQLPSREKAIGQGQWVGDRRGFTRIPSRDGVTSIPLFSDNGLTSHPSDSFGTGSNPMGLPGLG